MSTAHSEITRHAPAPEDTTILWLRGDAIKSQMAAALPKTITPDRFIRLCLTCIRKTPDLARCDRQSLLSALFEVAQLGLEPSTPLGQAWIIPFKTTAQVIVGYKGFISLAWRSGIIIFAEVVYEGDEFEFVQGEVLKHKPVEDEGKQGELRYAYATAIFGDKRRLSWIINRADIAKAKKSSAAVRYNKQDSPWFTDQPSMWRKTAVRRLATFLPMSPELARAIELDDQAERGDAQAFEAPQITVEPVNPLEEKRAELIAALESEGPALGLTRKGLEELITRPLEQATQADIARIKDAFITARAEKAKAEAQSQTPSTPEPPQTTEAVAAESRKQAADLFDGKPKKSR